MPLSDRRVSAVGIRDEEVWLAVQSSCNGTCDKPFIVRRNTKTNALEGFITQINSPLPFDNTSALVRAIFTDSQGRTFVGLNSGFGFGVMEPNAPNMTSSWTMVTQNNSPLPNGASINFNAITEINGEIWIGTNMGLLIYDGIGSLTDCASNILYTTAKGLPSNNITDIAYDINRQNVWITSDAGVSTFRDEHTITGNIVDVYCGKFGAITPTIQKKALSGVKVRLYNQGGPFDNLIVNSTTTDAQVNSNFNAN
jgi:hypothetical protein